MCVEMVQLQSNLSKRLYSLFEFLLLRKRLSLGEVDGIRSHLLLPFTEFRHFLLFFGLENAGNQSNGGRANDLIINHTCKFKNKTIDVMSEELQTIDSDTGIVFSAFREAISDVPPSEAQLSLDTYYSLSDYTASDDTQVYGCVSCLCAISLYLSTGRTVCFQKIGLLSCF